VICPTGKSLPIIRSNVKSFGEKYLSSVFQKYMVVSAHPASTRGAYRDRHGRRKRDAVDEKVLQARLRADEGISSDGQAVWSCPPDAGVKPAIRFFARRRWLTSPVHRGEYGAAVKTIAQGKSECLRWTCMLVCVSFAQFAHETAGAARIRLSLRPLDFEGRYRCITRAICAARMWRLVIPSEAKQSRPPPRRRCGLLRRSAPRNDEAARKAPAKG